MSLSPWFSLVEHEYPEREGVYQIQAATGSMYFAYWDGKQFGYPCQKVDAALLLQADYTCDWVVITRWRGSIREV